MKWAGRASASSCPYSRRFAGLARDDEGPAPSAGPPSAAPMSPRTRSAPAKASGADAGTFAHWSQPSGGTSSSSGISTTAAPGPLAATGTNEVGGTATATAMVATVVDAAGFGSTSAAAGCGSTSAASCGSSTTAAACRTSAVVGRGTAVVATGCGAVASVALCEPLLAADAVLAAARDALDERRLAGMTASVLSTLAGARGGTVGATLRARKRET
jgi:hypothetical protein